MGRKLFFLLAAILCSAESNYFGPTEPIPGRPHLIRIEVLIRDSPKQAGLQIQSVEFNQQAIALKPRDISGNRGKASFQVSPGNYLLRWVVNRDRLIWPRTITYEKEIPVSPRDSWIQITIEGEEATIL